MTAKIRIEKADSTVYYIMVQVQEVTVEDVWQNVGEPTALRYPCQLEEIYIHQNRRAIVYELPMGNA